MRVLLKGWEQFDEPVDRIVSIGAFEHFGHDRHDEFFKMAYAALPDDGVMLLHTICGVSMEYAREQGIPLTMELARLVRFIMKEIFPGGQLCTTPRVGELAGAAGFTVTQTQSLQPHYARTLAIWADTLRSNRDEAVALAFRGRLRPLHDIPERVCEGLRDASGRGKPVHAAEVAPNWSRDPR